MPTSLPPGTQVVPPVFFRLAAALCLCLLLAACDAFESKPPTALPARAVLVAGGGNFGDQDGTLTAYDPAAAQVVGTTDLGAFVQGLAVHEGQVYALLNTFSTGRLAVLDAQGQPQRQIPVPAPRGVAFLGGRAYVTNLSAFGPGGPEPGTVSVVDLAAGQAVGTPLPVGIYPEGIAAAAGRLFVANTGALGAGTTLTVLDPATARAVQTLELGCDGPDEVFTDGDAVVVVCTGKTVYSPDFSSIIEQTPGQVVVVDAAALQVRARLALGRPVGSANGAQTAFYLPAADLLFVIDGEDAVLRVAVNRLTAATITVPRPADLSGLTAVAYDAGRGRLYVARNARGPGGGPDYQAAGAVQVLDADARVLARFRVGNAPTHIALLP